MFPVIRKINFGIHGISTVKVVTTLVINILFLYVLFLTEFLVIKRVVNRPRGAKRTLKIWLSFFGILIGLAFVSTLISQLLGRWVWFRGDLTPSMFSIFSLMRDLIAFVLSILFTALIYLINKNQKNMIENERLVTENILNRYNALKNQTDPHFLFNSLNTLNGLIGYDNERAHEYVEQLSAVFRYTMQENSVVSLSEELQFAESYISLMKIRYGDGLSIKMNVQAHYNDYRILPFGVQVLVENAVKHNVISKKYPLEITIETTPDAKLRVLNNLQPKHTTAESTGLGLANLNERYKLMFGREIEIKTDNRFFSVEIPLMKKTNK